MPEIVEEEDRHKTNNRGEMRHFRRGVEPVFWRQFAFVIHQAWWFSASGGDFFDEGRGHTRVFLLNVSI
jgi:hypothetical protein